MTVEEVQRRQASAPPVEEGPAEVDTGTTGRRRVARTATQAVAAQWLAGRLVERKFKDPATGRARIYQGVLQYQGPEIAPHFFIVKFEDGDQHPMSLAMAQRYLLPEGEVMPAAVASAVQLQPPAAWDLLGQPDQLLAVLQQLMPGEWQSRWVTRMANNTAAVQAAAGQQRQPLPLTLTDPAEVDILVSRVLLQQCQHVLEPFNGTGTVARALLAAGCPRVTTNDLSSQQAEC